MICFNSYTILYDPIVLLTRDVKNMSIIYKTISGLKNIFLKYLSIIQFISLFRWTRNTFKGEETLCIFVHT